MLQIFPCGKQGPSFWHEWPMPCVRMSADRCPRDLRGQGISSHGSDLGSSGKFSFQCQEGLWETINYCGYHHARHVHYSPTDNLNNPIREPQSANQLKCRLSSTFPSHTFYGTEHRSAMKIKSHCNSRESWKTVKMLIMVKSSSSARMLAQSLGMSTMTMSLMQCQWPVETADEIPVGTQPDNMRRDWWIASCIPRTPRY